MSKLRYTLCKDCGGVYCITADWCEGDCNKSGGKNTKRLEKLFYMNSKAYEETNKADEAT